MKPTEKQFIVLRQLTQSDLGWFAEPRDRGLVKSKQRAVNFNAPIIARILSAADIAEGEVMLKAKCVRPDAMGEERRILKKVGKNWRLGGHKVQGEIFLQAKPGDYFVGSFTLGAAPPYELAWTVVFKALDPREHAFITDTFSPQMIDRMLLLPGESHVLATLNALLLQRAPTPRPAPPKPAVQKPQPPEPPKTNPISNHSRRALSVRERLKQPHILGELLKLSLTHSAAAQKNYLDALENTANTVRDMLDAAGLIHSITVDHNRLWKSIAGRMLAFVDGGVANISSLGAEPVAIRVGSYTVTPGRNDERRENFRIEKQLVAELYESKSVSGLFEDLFDDPSKLRDAARFSLELAAAAELLKRNEKPEFVFLHGALVYPVSAYADEDFPKFSKRGLEMLVPDSTNRSERDAAFVSIYLHLLDQLRTSGANIASVVERASGSALVSQTLLENLKGSPGSPGDSAIEDLKHILIGYRIPDAVLFHAILNEGEYVSPVAVDRNVAHKRPRYSADIIAKYPLPHVTYLGVGEYAQPLRVEFFEQTPAGYALCLDIILHSCRLMPQYAFPAGLDIVDKFAKVPNWMARPINSSMAVQLLKRALDNGDPKIIEAAKRMLCGTTRDWLFRPNYTP